MLIVKIMSKFKNHAEDSVKIYYAYYIQYEMNNGQFISTRRMSLEDKGYV